MGADDALLVVIKVMNRLKKVGAILDYAIFGAMAVMKYTEPFNTKDLDILVSIKPQPVIVLSPIYDEFTKLGYQREGQHLIVEGFPIEFMVADELELEAMANANLVTVGGLKTKVLGPEYLIALATRSNRPKDRNKVVMLLTEFKVNQRKLEDILVKYKLRDRFERLYLWIQNQKE